MNKFRFSIAAYFTLLLLISNSLMAQSQGHNEEEHDYLPCGKNEATELYLEQNPGAAAIMQQEKEALEEFTRSFIQSGQRAETLIIPVVFHIVHANGEENISNAQIYSAIDVLNEDFNMLTAGVNSVVPQFQNIVGDVEFEFRLAKLDPQGNCTNGIVRTVSSQTFNGGENIKAISPTWGRSSYLNIWVCNTVDGAAGYAFLPGGAPVSGDGIILQHDYVGRIGTSNDSRSHALSHEVGHWSNLEHTWGETNTPGVASNCNTDDNVSDTPNTIGWTSCNLNGMTCGSLDNVQNFMDYSYCYRMFTTGQSNRMRAALNSGIAQRNQLHSDANLAETGVLAPDVVCQIDFTTDKERVICAGQSIVFEDLSYNGVTSWSWVFEGGNPATSSSPSPEVMYSTPGVYNVTLTATNANGSLADTKNDFITVLPIAENVLPFEEGFEGFSSLEPNDQNWFVVNPDGSNIKWALTSTAAYSGSKSVYVRGRQNTNGESEWLQSPTYDLTGLSDNAVLTFKYAHAKRQGSSDDRLRVWISRNCGETWSVRRTLDIDDLPTVPNTVISEFVPANQGDWAEVSISSIVSTFLTDEFRFRFEFTSFNGNNIYIDNINIVDGTLVGIDELIVAEDVDIFPNPTSGQAQLRYDLLKASQLNIELVDLTGRILSVVQSGQASAGEHRLDLDMTAYASGIYLLRFVAEGHQLTRKVVLQH